MKTAQHVLSAQQFDALFQSVCNWGAWGADDERGTLKRHHSRKRAQRGCPGSVGTHGFHGGSHQ